MNIKRRTFLTGAATLSAAGLVSLGGCQINTPTTSAKVVIAGGGAGGTGLANMLKRYLPGLSISIIEPRPQHWYQPGQTLLLAGVYTEAADVLSPHTDYLDSDINWIPDSVTEFLPDTNQVVTASGATIAYDYLIVATGLELRYDLIEGLDTREIGHNGIHSIYFSPEAGLASYKEALAFASRGEGRGVFTRPQGPMKCAGAPLKATNLVEYFVRESGQRNNYSLNYYTSEATLFSVKAFNQKLNEIWTERDITAHYGRVLTAVDSQNKTASFTKTDGSVETVEWDFLHIAPPMSAVPAVRNSELADNTTFVGYLEVDRYTMQHKHYPNVFGLGDSVGTPIGKTAASVKSQIPVITENLSALIQGQPLVAKWSGYTSCPMILDVGHAMLWEFDYSMEPVTALPFEVVDPLSESKLAWVMEKSLIKPVYDLMLHGYTPI
ncbi:NAD(P)/FAD-dependent oxidoreductase [Parendozoicomonas haliclonae]|uniref:Sulfide dehydrogenase [flavocytochrome c] flavoprotein chain n=1 Tax=Parendozoicomonas haliclonae TaxID=1960125 RepID=A0A1X7ARK4_9GAMM|nr:FAD/NAD(P)-binding oxidoreductase [Parendozoicomonas haliclonae]SMA50729.1 Sulfide dehydrogenase [flavocytochrome c] flavoprotein chain precursor [Parendozoicomonas haliclonae]